MADRKFSYVQFDAPQNISDKVRHLQSQISPEDLDPDGLELEPHVTVLWGLHTNDHRAVAGAMGYDAGPVEWHTTELSLFDGKRRDVLKLNVMGVSLFHLNQRLRKALPHEGTFPYSPHVTVAYLKPGMGAVYLRNLYSRWRLDAKSDVLVFHSKDRQRYEIPIRTQRQLW